MRALATLAAFVCLISPVAAQECVPMSAAAANLAANYGEMPAAGAVVKGGTPMMIFANASTGTWTILLSVDGCARIVSAGTDWMTAPPGVATKPGEGA